MPTKRIARPTNLRCFMQSLLLGAAGSALTTAAAQAQACTAVGGTITVPSGVTCGALVLTGGTNLVVDVGGKVTSASSSTVAGGTQGNITVNGEISQTSSQNAITANGGVSVGNVTIGVNGRVSNIGGTPAIDYRNVSTSLGSFTNLGTLTATGGSAFSTSVATVGGDITNNGSITALINGIFTQNQTINGSINNGANGRIATTGTGTNYSGIRFFSNVVLKGDLLNAGTISGAAGSGAAGGVGNFTSGIMTSGPSSSISRSLTNSGPIFGYNIGVNLANTSVAGGLTNSGTITNVVDRGISVSAGTFGSFLNSNTITATDVGSYGVISTNATYRGAFVNSGTITAGNSGVNLVSGNTLVSLLNSGTITAAQGVFSGTSTFSGSVTNSGKINARCAGMNMTGGSVTGDIANNATGEIYTSAASSNGISTSGVVVGGNVTNAGLITSTASGTGARTGISVSTSSIAGNLSNSGTINGVTTGVSASNLSIGNVINSASGKITATGVGVNLSSVTAGSLQNLALVTAGTRGLIISGGRLGGVRNSGTITTTGADSENNGVYLLGNAKLTGDLINSGLISGKAGAGANKTAGIRLDTASLDAAATFGAVAAAAMAEPAAIDPAVPTDPAVEVAAAAAAAAGAELAAANAAALDPAGVDPAAPGGDPALSDPPATDLVGAAAPIDPTLVDPASLSVSIVNSGTIEGYNYGVRLDGSMVTGSVTNSGTITSVDSGVLATSSTVGGGIVNSGTITTSGTAATSNGIELQTATLAGNLTNSGTLSGKAGIGATTAGILTSGGSIGGAVTNSGTITGYNFGMSLTNTPVTGAVTNSTGGVINVAGVGLNLSGVTAASLQNLGSISAVTQGLNVSGGTLGSVLNSGTIATTGTGSENNGIYLLGGARITGDITNSGWISGRAGADPNKTAGIRLNSGTIGGSLVNSGTIEGYNYGVRIASAPVTGSVTNSGTITAVDDGVLSTSSVTGGVRNLAGGKINADGYGFNLNDSGASYGGILNAGEMTTVRSGVRANVVTINGDVLNSGGITTTGAGATSNGFELQMSPVTGNLTNSGTLSGKAGLGATTAGILTSGASIGGAVTNSGTISGYDYGLLMSATPIGGALTNSFQIISNKDAVAVSGAPIGGDVTNTATGQIKSGGYGFNIANFGTMGAFSNFGTISSGNSAMFASAGTINGDVSNTGAITTTGTATTSNGIELQTARVAGNLINSGTMSGQAGTGVATTAGILTSGGSIGGAAMNSGSISGYDYGLRMTTTPIAGALTNSGTIDIGTDAVALSGASIGGTVSNTSSGVINAGGYGFNVANFGAMGAFTNYGAISSGNSAMFASAGTINGDVLNAKMINTTGTAATSNGIELQAASVTGNLINSGTMTGQAGTNGAITTGILTSGGSIAGGVRNTGSVSGYNDGFSLSGTTVGGAIDNTGSVYARRYGFNLADAGTIGAFNNFGVIAAGVAGVNATGSTLIQNMTNAQGVGNSAGPLTYSGTLPSNYFIVINGSSYGQLAVDLANHSGKMSFGISPLSSGVAPRNYFTVLSGVSIGDLTNPNSTQATFGDRGRLVLRQQRGSATTWDLRIEGLWNPYIGYNNPNIVSTYQAMNANRLATEGVLHQRYAVLNAVAQYDCDRFEKHNLCLQFQTRETGFGTQTTSAGVFNASYRVAERFRVGGYLDYQTWARTPFGVSPGTGGVQPGYNLATFGAYIGYSARDDQTGMQARISGGHNSGRLNVVRAFLAGSEPGFGDARLNAFYLYGVAGYGLKLRNGMILTPYAGLQYTGVTREAFTETFATETIFPMIYNAYYERLITGLAGVKMSGMADERLGYEASMGSQIDLSRSANAYGGVSMAPGMESFGIAHGGSWNGVRPSGMAGLFYAPLPNHRLSINGYANQQAWTSRTYVTGLLGYQVGF